MASWKPWPQCCSNSKTKFTKADFFGLLGLEGLKFWDAPRVSAVCRLGVHTTALLSLILFYNIYIYRYVHIYVIYVSIYNYVYTHNYIYISCLWLMTIYRHVFRYCIYIRTFIQKIIVEYDPCTWLTVPDWSRKNRGSSSCCHVKKWHGMVEKPLHSWCKSM